jgi:hypothetical protein
MNTLGVRKLKTILTLLKRLHITVEKIATTKDAYYLETNRGVIRLSENGKTQLEKYTKIPDYKLYFTMSDISITSALIRR